MERGRKESPASFGSEDYREGSLLRLTEAQALYEAQSWVGCIYLAGRAAEAILRSLLWLKTRQQETGHDLKDLLKEVRLLIRFDPSDETILDDAVNELAVVWRNDLRFTGASRLSRLLKASGRDRSIGKMKVKGEPLKANPRACSKLVSGLSLEENPMPSLQDRLTDLFRQRLAEGHADLETLSNGHVAGHIISSDFLGEDYSERRARIRRVLEDAVADGILTNSELPAVSTLLTYTPAEWSVASAK